MTARYVLIDFFVSLVLALAGSFLVLVLAFG